jgi:hypothetical protein
MNFQQFGEIMAVMTDFYDRKPPKGQVSAWFEKIKHLAFDVAKEAANQCTACLPAFPVPAKFLEFADHAQARVSSQRQYTERKIASKFFKEETHNTQLAKDCVMAMNEIFSQPANLEGAANKFTIISNLAKKYHRLDWNENLLDIKRQIDFYESLEEKVKTYEAEQSKANLGGNDASVSQ